MDTQREVLWSCNQQDVDMNVAREGEEQVEVNSDKSSWT